MAAIVPLLALAALFAAARAARAQQLSPDCQSYSRASAGAPELVRSWLAHAADDRVIVCGAAGAAAPQYSAESSVTHADGVCSYTRHGLMPVGRGEQRQLRRYEQADALHMALAAGDCPAPHGGAPLYTETYDVSLAAFVSMMQLWRAAAASVHEFDQQCCEARPRAPSEHPPSSATAQRLRAAIEAGRMKSAPVKRIVRISGAGLRRRYALIVPDPDRAPQQSRLYVIYFSRWLGGPWHITGVADAAD